MGAFLSEPKTDKHTFIGEGNNIRWGASGMQGWRTEMEDAHIAATSTNSRSMSSPEVETIITHGLNALGKATFFGVFDGHGGSAMSTDVVAPDFGLLNEILKSEGFVSNLESGKADKIGEIIKRAFVSFDDHKKSTYEASAERSGCTATTVLVTPSHIICANAGDSRSVLCTVDAVIPLSFDHKPQNETEKLRIEGAGGSVMMGRVNGDLAVSRALGDYGYKCTDGMPTSKQMVSPEPDILIQPRDANKDLFIILACDGVWDVMKNEEACEFVKTNACKYPDLGYVCEALLDKCLELNSKDNMTVCIVAFNALPQVSVEERASLLQAMEERKAQLALAAAASQDKEEK